MSLQIAVAHTGQRFDADPVGFSSVDALKQWIATVVDIPPEHQILLTPRGKHVKLQTLLTEVPAAHLHPRPHADTVVESPIRLRSRTLCRVPRCLHRSTASRALRP
jgi:hypothetical protein